MALVRIAPCPLQLRAKIAVIGTKIGFYGAFAAGSTKIKRAKYPISALILRVKSDNITNAGSAKSEIDL